MGAPDDTESRAFAQRFESELAALPYAPDAGQRLIVAYSGGLDSTLLLHALKRARPGAPIVAVHVDHGLHPDAPLWTAHCAAEARALAIEFVSRSIALNRGAPIGIEAAAREARYAALSDIARAGDIVLTGHHADDQLETVLLRLLRGSGVRGLTAIHTLVPFGEAWLARPLLDFTRAELETEAHLRGLRWLEDPSNADLGFDRNYLRALVLPPIRDRWPGAGRIATRLARQMAEAESVLAEVAAADLAAADEPARIPIALLERLSEPRRNNALRHSIRSLGLPVPTARQLAEILRALEARADAEVEVRWPGGEARVYRGRLYLMAPLAQSAAVGGRIGIDSPFELATGRLSLVPVEADGIPDRWAREGLSVAFRRGGERFRPAGSRHGKSLKQWFQDAGIVPWMRGAIPLLYHGNELVAVADLSLCADLPAAPEDGPFWWPQWSGRPPLR